MSTEQDYAKLFFTKSMATTAESLNPIIMIKKSALYETVKASVSHSREPQTVLSEYIQKQANSIRRMFAKVIYDNTKPLAKIAVEETQIGVYGR